MAPTCTVAVNEQGIDWRHIVAYRLAGGHVVVLAITDGDFVIVHATPPLFGLQLRHDETCFCAVHEMALQAA